MLSQKAKYALRALQMLAADHDKGPVLIGEISVQQRVPRKFLELILVDLKRAGFVRSYRGRNGGYMLARAPKDIRFGAVIRLIDGPLALLPCASKTAYRKCEDCADENTCSIRRLMRKVRDEASRILDKATLADHL